MEYVVPMDYVREKEKVAYFNYGQLMIKNNIKGKKMKDSFMFV